MSRPPIDLEREFGEPAAHDDIDDRWERALGRLARKRKTWAHVSAHTTVVLGEGGTGKSTELQARANALNAAGTRAFFVPLAEFVGRELRRVLGVDAERLDAWLRSGDEAWFFLDGLDEGKLAGASLGGLLRDLESEILAGRGRSRLVISCRPSEWDAVADLAAARDNALRWKPGAQSPIDVLVMLPLDFDRGMRLARHFGVQDAEAFSTAIDAAGLELFLERPLDVDWFVSMWNERRTFGSLRQMIDENIRAKLTDRPRSKGARRLPADQARAGVRRLAAVATLSGQRAFPASAGAQRGAGGFRVADVLHEWCGEDVDGLLSLPMFDEAVGGMVRLHSKEVQEFLCAEWLTQEMRAGALSVDEMTSLLFVHHGAQRVVPSHLVRVAAWLAPMQPRIFDLLVECAPHQLLDEGDPAALPTPDRERALRAFAERYRERNRIDIHFTARGLRRFADAALGPTIEALLTSAKSEDVRAVMLQLVSFGKLEDLADTALRIALEPSESPHVRYFAVAAAALAGTPRHRDALHALLDEGKELDLELAAQVIEHLFPSKATPADLGKILHALAPRGRTSTHTRLDTVLSDRVPKLCPQHAQQQLLKSLLDAHEHAAEDWLVRPIAKLVAVIIESRPAQIDEPQTSRALSIFDEEDSGHDAKPILDVARANEHVRRRLLWRHVENIRAAKKEFNAWRLRHSGLIGRALDIDDFRWLEVEARARADVEVAEGAQQVWNAIETPYEPPELEEEPAFDTASREQIDGHLEEIRAGHARLLRFCTDPFGTTGDGWGTLNVAALAVELPASVVEAIRTGLATFWRKTNIASPREWGQQNTPGEAVLGLRALAWELGESATCGALTESEAVRATRYGLWEVSNFPEWLVDVRTFHPAAVDDEICLEAVHELRSGDTRERVLMKLFSTPVAMRRTITGRIEQVMLAEPVPWSPAFQTAVSLVSLTDASDPSAWITILESRMQAADNDELFAAYWLLELRANGTSAIARLERLLNGEDRDVARVDGVLRRLWRRIDEESIPFAHAEDSELLERLYLLLMNPRLSPSDSVFDGRARLRSAIERWLSKSPRGADAFARMAARDEARFREWREHFLRLADQSLLSMPSMMPMSRTDAVNWTRAYEITASDEASLFAIAEARIENIATFVAHDRHSYRSLFHRDGGPVLERDFQLWLASELSTRSAGQYKVVREEEDADRKRPDITLHVAGLMPLSVEIKVADRCSYTELFSALSDQLVARYMHEARSRVGILVLCVTHRTSWPTSDGARISLAEVVAGLRQEASKLVASRARDVHRLAVKVLDFRTP